MLLYQSSSDAGQCGCYSVHPATGRMNVLPCNVIHLEVIGKNIFWVLPNLIKGHLPYLSEVVSAQL